MSEGLKPGDRVLDRRAVARSGGMFAGLVVAPVAAGLSGWWWGWCPLAAVVGAIAGFVIAAGVGRAVFPAPPGQTVVTRVGPASLAVALRASFAGGLPACIVGAIGVYLGAGWLAAALALVVGLAVSLTAGCLAALL